MTEPPNAMNIDGVWVWPDPTREGRFVYLPEAPVPVISPAGAPQISAIFTGGRLILSLAAELAVGASTVAKIAAALAAQKGGAAGRPELQPAMVAVPSARLVLRDAKGERTIATITPSNMPPYRAAFSATLEGADAETAASALDGSPPSPLSVVFDVEIAGERHATARLSGDLAAALAGLPEDAGAARVAEGLRAAEASGALGWDESADPDTSEALKETARDAAFSAAVETATRLQAGPAYGGTASGGLDSAATRTEATRLDLSLGADVSHWRGAGGASVVMRM